MAACTDRGFRGGTRAQRGLLAARLLLVVLYVVSGWQKLTNFSGAVSYMTAVGAPAPALAAIIAVLVKLGLAVLLGLGLLTRPLSPLFAAYTVATAIIGHHFWTMTGAVRADNFIHLFKNMAIAGGFLLLYAAGPGAFALDRYVIARRNGAPRYDALAP